MLFRHDVRTGGPFLYPWLKTNRRPCVVRAQQARPREMTCFPTQHREGAQAQLVLGSSDAIYRRTGINRRTALQQQRSFPQNRVQKKNNIRRETDIQDVSRGRRSSAVHHPLTQYSTRETSAKIVAESKTSRTGSGPKGFPARDGVVECIKCDGVG